MSDHSSFVALATRLIKEHGRDITIVSFKPVGVEYDPANLATESTVKAVQTSFKNSEVNGETVLKTDLKYLIDSSVAPTIDGLIKDKGKEYSIIDFELVAPGEQDILYKIQARL